MVERSIENREVARSNRAGDIKRQKASSCAGGPPFRQWVQRPLSELRSFNEVLDGVAQMVEHLRVLPKAVLFRRVSWVRAPSPSLTYAVCGVHFGQQKH